jgi:nicotinamidase-related amidase
MVVVGITTNHCCEMTARVGGGNLGYDVFFGLDATHLFDRTGLTAGCTARTNSLR